MIYTVDIRESDISVAEKFIAVIWEQETEDGPRSAFDVATSNDIKVLRRWAKNIVG